MVCRSLCPQHPSQGHAHSRCHTLSLRTTDVAGSGNWAPGRERGRIQSPDNTSSSLAQRAEWVGLYLRESRGRATNWGGPLRGVLLDALSPLSLCERQPLGSSQILHLSSERDVTCPRPHGRSTAGFEPRWGWSQSPRSTTLTPELDSPNSAPHWHGTVRPSLAPGLSPSSLQ